MPNDGAHGVEDAVFTDIVSMCSARILSRLRFTGRKKSRLGIKEALSESMKAIKQLESILAGDVLRYSEVYVKRAKDVIRLVNAWVNYRTLPQLEQLVEGIGQLSEIDGLKSLFESIPKQLMDPSLRESLLNIINKVARYREAARYLYRTAKRHSSVRHMIVIPVRLPQNVFNRVIFNDYNPTLSSTLLRIGRKYHHYDLGDICRLLKKNAAQASAQFTDLTLKILKKSKVHAEIQLMYYCEMNPCRLPPRVVCSSKDACFLCNAFIDNNGKTHIPGHHGKLYPKWRLPMVPNLDEIARRFNAVLENHVRDSLSTLLSRREKTSYPDPNESTLLTLAMSTSTARSVAFPPGPVEEPIRVIQHEPVEDVIASDSSSNFTAIVVSSGSSEQTQSERPTTQMGQIVTNEQEGNSDRQTPLLNDSLSGLSNLSSHSSSNASCISDEVLIPGVEESLRTTVAHRARVYQAGFLEVQIGHEKEDSHASSGKKPSKVVYGIEWLNSEAVGTLLEKGERAIVDVGELAVDEDVSHELDSSNCLFLKARNSVVKVHFLPE